MELHTSLGLKSNPFSKRSSEEELDFINDIFFQPNYYPTLLTRLVSGDSTLIIGQRGHGKSSIVNKLFDDISVKKDFLVIKIDRFDSIPLRENEIAFLQLIVEKITTYIIAFLLKNKESIKKLNRIDKEKLAFFINHFFFTISDSEFNEVYENTQTIRNKNLLKRLYNGIVPYILNTTANILINISATTVTKHFGLNSIDTTSLNKEFFPNFQIEKGIQTKLDETKCSVEELKKILDNILEVSQKVGIQKVIVLFDKVDEYRALEQDLDKITLFIKDVLADTELMLNNKISIGFSFWSELKNKLVGIVRYDKFGSVDVRWLDKDLEPLINTRIKHFSLRHDIMLSDLIPYIQDRNEIIKLSNKSPRDLIILLNYQ